MTEQGNFTIVTSALRLELLPAVDVSGGQAVQLVQGVAGTGGQFGDPWEAHRSRVSRHADLYCSKHGVRPRNVLMPIRPGGMS